MGLLDEIAHFAADQLLANARVQEVLWARGVTDAQIESFQLGYLNRGLPPISDVNFLKWSGNGNKLDDVFVFPLTTALGVVRGLQFRYVDRERSGYMDYLLPTDEPVLFGLCQAAPAIWSSESIYIVEGAFDLFPVQRYFSGTVATLTARVVTPVVRMLRRLVRTVWLGYDADATGRRASEQFIRLHGQDFVVKNVLYPRIPMVGGKVSKDPGDLWETWGEARFGQFMRTLGAANQEL